MSVDMSSRPRRPPDGAANADAGRLRAPAEQEASQLALGEDLQIIRQPTPVDHPAHYQSAGSTAEDGNIEVIDVIEAYGLGESFALGNAAKYLLRAGCKGDLSGDLGKALWYVERAIDRDELEPVADDEALATWTPDTVVAAFGLDGQHGEAMRRLLELCAFSDEPPAPGDWDAGLTRLEAVAAVLRDAIEDAAL